jgi:hypothetical protein
MASADIRHGENGSTAMLVRVPATLLADFNAWVDGQSSGRLIPPAIRRLVEQRLAQGDTSELKRPKLPSSSASTRSSRVEARATARTTALWTLTLFGLASVTAMLIFYVLEDRSSWYILAFAGACALGSGYGFMQGTWPFGLSRPYDR